MKRALTCLLIAAGAWLTGCKSNEPVLSYPYLEPLRSPGAKLSGLPPAAQRTIRAQTGTADIYDIVKHSVYHADFNEYHVVYQVFFQRPEMFPPLYVAPDGSVLYPNMLTVAVPAVDDDIGASSGGAVGGVRFSDLPIKVANTVLEKAPTSEVEFINRIVVDYRTFYEVTFKGAGNPKLLVSEDGTLIDKLPSPVDTAIPFKPVIPKSQSPGVAR